MELLVIPLSQRAGKWLVIPKGEGYGSSLREFHVKNAMKRRVSDSVLPALAKDGILIVFLIESRVFSGEEN